MDGISAISLVRVRVTWRGMILVGINIVGHQQINFDVNVAARKCESVNI